MEQNIEAKIKVEGIEIPVKIPVPLISPPESRLIFNINYNVIGEEFSPIEKANFHMFMQKKLVQLIHDFNEQDEKGWK